MKTDELVAMLASSVEAVPLHSSERRHAIALACGLPVALALMVVFIGVRPDITEAVALPMFWMKLAFPAVLLAGGAFAAIRLSRPGGRMGVTAVALAAPVLAIWLLAAVTLAGAAPAEYGLLIFGQTWAACPFMIALLAVPLFVALIWAMQGLAPTRPALAGAVAGLVAGAGGALVYAPHCPEMAAPFLGAWYVLGMAIPAIAGALLGPRLLRW